MNKQIVVLGLSLVISMAAHADGPAEPEWLKGFPVQVVCHGTDPATGKQGVLAVGINLAKNELQWVEDFGDPQAEQGAPLGGHLGSFGYGQGIYSHSGVSISSGSYGWNGPFLHLFSEQEQVYRITHYSKVDLEIETDAQTGKGTIGSLVTGQWFGSGFYASKDLPTTDHPAVKGWECAFQGI